MESASFAEKPHVRECCCFAFVENALFKSFINDPCSVVGAPFLLSLRPFTKITFQVQPS